MNEQPKPKYANALAERMGKAGKASWEKNKATWKARSAKGGSATAAKLRALPPSGGQL